MGNYTGVYLTQKGRNLIAKSLTGNQLKFTRVKIGDGQPAPGQKLDELNDLIAPKKELRINSIKADGDGQCRVRTHLTNIGLDVGLFVYELGVYALDPDDGEILYGYTTADTPDFLPPEGGSTHINHQFDVITIVGNATNISAKIDLDGYVSQADFEEMKNELQRVLVQQEINGRVPENNKGTFFDTFEDVGPTRMNFLNSTADLSENVAAGTLTLPVIVVKGSFSTGEEIVIMDDQNVETLFITAVKSNEISVAQLVHGFKKGATIARSTANINTTEKSMKVPYWGTYTVNTMEVV